MEKKRVSFTVTGAFVTKTAREWFWEEGKPWEKVEEFLLACMCGTDKSREELVALARDVVLGRAKFIGDTADGSYAMVTDDGEYAIKAAGKLLKRLKDEKEERRDLEIRLENLVDRIADEDCEWLLEERKPTEADMSPLLSSFLEQRKIENEHEDNYGWLEPNGEFHPVEFAEYQSWAREKVIELGWIGEDRDSWVDADGNTHYLCTGNEGDILVEHGWVLLHNPGRGIVFATSSDEKPLTKAKREFLFGYYTDRGRHDIAKKYLEES